MFLDLGDGFCVREYRLDDVEALCKHADNPRVAAKLRDRFPHPYTVEDARTWIATVTQFDPQTAFAIATADELVGGIGLELGADVEARCGEVGYWLGEEYWGRGLATRAVRAFCDWAFGESGIVEGGLIRIWAGTMAHNPASGRVLEKAGFTFEGRHRCAIFKAGKVRDQLVYALIAPGVEADED